MTLRAQPVDVDTFRKILQEELDKALKPIKEDASETRKRVNQIYDAMEQQGYRFPKAS